MAPNSRFAIAVHLLTALAHGDVQRTSGDLARSVNTNPVVVRRALGLLARAGLVTTQPGAAGGYRLARDPSRITLRDVYRAVETEGLFSVHANPPVQACAVSCSIKEILGDLFGGVERRVEDELRRTSVADLLRRVRRETGHSA